MPDLPFLDVVFLRNPLSVWAVALGISFSFFVFFYLLRRLIAGKLRDLLSRFRLEWPRYLIEALSRTQSSLLLVFALRSGMTALKLPAHAVEWGDRIAWVAFAFQSGIWAMAIVSAWHKNWYKSQFGQSPSSITIMGAAKVFVDVMIWIGVFLAILHILGINVTTLVAGLGIGGIAVALAVQNTLGNLLASLGIIMDKPFVVGDSLSIGDLQGTVEKIGLKTTRVRSVSGEQLIFSNSDMLTARIRNYGRMQERRVIMQFGVTYQTPIETLEAIPGMVRTIVEAQPTARFDRAHFKTHGGSSLDFEYVYYVTTSDYITYMDTRQAINFALHRRFAEAGIEFAYPTQTIFIEKTAS